MFAFLRGAAREQPMSLPLFPLHTVLYPGGVLPLKIFEQRYVEMAKACLKDGQPFGVCLIRQGEEVAQDGVGPPEFASIGTLATIASWDMPQLGILHVTSTGSERFEVRSHAVRADGLLVAEVAPIPAEPAVALPAAYAQLARLLELLANRVGPRHFPAASAYTDASWVGYRLAELLPLPLPIKQSMLEINDSEVRLEALRTFLAQQGVWRDP
jgi:Lon protease-like protein